MAETAVLQEQVDRAIEVLRVGGVVAYPTDTVYGLGANAFDEAAVARVYEIKGRPRQQPIPILVADMAGMEMVAREVPEIARRLAERFLPGGLTLVLLKAPRVSPLVSGGGDTVAVRIPDHPVPLALIRGLGAPITGTSANPSSQPSPTTAEGVRRFLGDKVDLIIDGGRCPGGVASTVVDATGTSPRLVREGAIPRQALEEALRMKLT